VPIKIKHKPKRKIPEGVYVNEAILTCSVPCGMTDDRKYLFLPPAVAEYKFHPTRRWKIDYAYPEKKLAVEIEGAVWTGGRHTRGSGFVGDMEKYNELAAMGWRLLRFLPHRTNRSGSRYPGTGANITLIARALKLHEH
jgi:hypothetical protein